MRDKFLPQFNEPPALNSESERTKEVEQVIDRRLEEMLVRHTELVNQGVNGFIFKMEMTGIQPGVIEQLKTAGLNLETNPDKQRAVKVFKIYEAGKGRQEYEAQKKAFELLATVPEQERSRYARIPNPEIYRNLEISDESKQILEEHQVQLKGNQLEIIVMDFIEGEDLATLYDRWILCHLPEDTDPKLRAEFEALSETKDFVQLHRAMADAIEFMKLPVREKRPLKRNLYQVDTDRIYDALKRTNFPLPTSIADQLKNTLTLLEKNGMPHPDQHERNIMITQERAHLVDFGLPKSSEDSERESNFQITGILSELARHGERRGSKEHEKNETLRVEREKIETLAKTEELIAQVEQIREISRTRRKDLSEAVVNFTADLTQNADKLRELIAILSAYHEKGEMTDKVALGIIEQKQQSLIKRDRSGKIEKISNPFVFNQLESYKAFFVVKKTPVDTRKTGNRQESQPLVKLANRPKRSGAQSR